MREYGNSFFRCRNLTTFALSSFVLVLQAAVHASFEEKLESVALIVGSHEFNVHQRFVMVLGGNRDRARRDDDSGELLAPRQGNLTRQPAIENIGRPLGQASDQIVVRRSVLRITQIKLRAPR